MASETSGGQRVHQVRTWCSQAMRRGAQVLCGWALAGAAQHKPGTTPLVLQSTLSCCSVHVLIAQDCLA